MDSRLLRDVGLMREDVRRGVPFRAVAPQPTTLIRLGTLEVQDWQLKLYARVAEVAGLRPEDLASVRRAFRAVLAELFREPVAGFAVLSSIHEIHLPAGSLALTVCQWDGLELWRCKLLLPVENGPVRRVLDHGFGIAELLLTAGEGRAWQRHACRPLPSSLAAYVAEDHPYGPSRVHASVSSSTELALIAT
jgi:hypothetical protein